MKPDKVVFLLAAFLAAVGTGYAGTVDSPYEVGNWSGFKTAAVTYTFDDGCSNQAAIAIPMFDEYGFKMTLYPVINWGPNWTALQAAASEGHEIGSHTMSHSSLGGLTIEQQTTELADSQDAVNSHISGQQCLTIAYPYCSPSDQTLTATYYIAGRHCQGAIEANTPSNFYQISSIICGNSAAGPNTAADFNTKFASVAASKGWCVFLIHGIDSDGGYSPLPSTVLRASLNYLDTHRDTHWVATFANVVRYIRERNDVSVSETSNMGDSITLSVTDTLNDTIYNYPLTIRRPFPPGWGAVSVSQNSVTEESSVVTVGLTQYIMFDAVPDGGEVIISKIISQPAGLTAIVNDTTVVLDWNDNNEGDVAGYNVYRSTTSGGGYSKLNNSLLTESDYNDSNVALSTTYYYVITAVDANLIETAYSSEVSAVIPDALSVKKCTVTAGKIVGIGTIAVSGDMNATADDISGADYIQVTIDSNDTVSPCVETFPIDGNSFKKGSKYNYARTENASKTSFKFDTKTGKFSFTAKNVDLAGLDCPLTIEIETGDYICEAEVNETIVNSKKPIPINLLMGVKDSLRVDKITVKQNTTKTGSDQMTVKGGFSVEDTSVNMVDEEFVVTLDSQTFTLPAGSFIAKTGQFTCKKIAPTETEGGIASATFNFTKCSFTMTIKNTEIEAGSGTVDFCVAFAGYSQCVQVTLPTAPTRCTFTISPTAESFTAGGGDGSVTVTTSNGCAWTATSHASWIIITSGSSGSGSGTVGYSVAANGGTAERTGTMTISGHTFTVTQAKPTADIPSAPTGVTASAGDGQVSISWSAVSGATSYNIYWSTTSGVTKTNGTKITDATSPYSHTILTNGTTYYYIVTAVNSSGESMESAQVSATPTAVQDPPIKLFNAGVSPWINDIMEDSSNNILVAGTQDDGRSIVVLKLSSAGTQAWNKYFPAGTDVITNNIFEVPSQGYLVTGCIDSTSGSLFKMQLDTAGNQSAPDYFDCGLGFIDPGSSDSVMLSDGSVIFAGNTQYKDSCNTFIPYGNALITGINSSGMQYFRSDYDYAPGYSENFNSVIALSGGGFAAAGEADLYDNGDGYSGPYNAILIKTDSLGSVIWTQNYGYKTDDLGNDGVIDLIQTSDNGYAMLAKLGYNYDMYVIKTDSSGNSTAAFNAATGDSCYNGRKFVQSGDNGFVIAGQGSGCHGAVVKMSAAGVKVWEYNTDYNPTAIVKSASGGYLIAGDAYVDMGVYKIFVFKLDDLGKRVW